MSLEKAGELAQQSTPFADIASVIEALNGWGTIGLITVVLVVAWIVWRLNSGATPFRVGDALIDPMTGKASILRLGFFVCLIMTWAVIGFCVMQGKAIPGELIAILTVFVAPVIANRFAENYDPRVKAAAINAAPSMANEPAPAAQPAGDITIKTEIKP